MPRFVLLLHVMPPDAQRPSHCDLMLEVGDVLHTWSLAELPRDWAAIDPENRIALSAENEIEAIQLADHRKAYLDHEGPVSGDRGSVRRLEAGDYELESESPEALVAALTGKHIRGQIIVHSKNTAHKLFSIQFVRR